jgi:hypothetical protein
VDDEAAGAEDSMRKARLVGGWIGGAVMVLSSAMHSFLGWKALGQQLAATEAPAGLVRDLALGWHFAGAAMLVLGVIVCAGFAAALKGRAVPPLPAVAIGLLYVVFGVAAFALSALNPFFAIFVVPGLLVLWGSGAMRPS